MFYYLVLLFTIIPIVELYLLIRVGAYLGASTTIMIVIFTGIFGAYLARLEGLRVLYSVQKDMQEGRMPANQILDGVLILVGAILLITPGLLTDALGLALVFSQTRAFIKVWVKLCIQKNIDKRDDVITVEGYSEDNE